MLVLQMKHTCGKMSKLICPPMEYTRFRCANFSRRIPTNFFLHEQKRGRMSCNLMPEQAVDALQLLTDRLELLTC